MLQIIKRSNEKVFFDKQKIVNAINNAFLEVDGVLYEQDTANDIANDIEEIAKENIEKHTFTVEDIQDLVEEFLMRSERKDVARAYIRYRYKKEVARERSFEFKQAVVDKLMAKNIQNQNANVDEASFGGRTGEASGFVTKQLALEDVVSETARKNHDNNIIYIHDLDNYYVGSHNCLSIPFDDLLEKGFITRQTSVRPAQSIDTAFQLIAVIFQLQSLNQFGGVSATHLDWTMVPYVRKSYYSHLKDALKFMADKYTYKSFCCEYKRIKNDAKVSILNPDWSEYFGGINIPKQAYKYAYEQTQKEVYKAADGMLHNLNTLQSRSGNQLPFTSINYGTCTMPEGRMVTKAILDCTITGIGKNYRTPVFPCQIFQCMKGVNRKPGDANYDLFKIALESTSKRLYPNYANVDWSGNAGYDINDPRTYFSTMGCRTANGWDINGFGQLKDGRGNICPVTIILPTIAMQAKTASNNPNGWDSENDLINYFLRKLDQKIFEAKDMLIERFEWICAQPAASAKFMYQNNVMKGYVPEEGIRSALKHGTLAIGQLGLAEALQILIGCDHTEEKGMSLAKRIEALFKKRCAEFKEEYKLNFGVYYTPAENLCYTALKKFKDKYGIIENVSDKKFFTNSMHVPVWKEVTPFEKIDIESQLTGYSSAGCITYVELNENVKDNIEGLENLVNYAMDKDIPYFAINVPSDTCLDCGHQGLIDAACPNCGSENIERLRRVTGYLTGNYTTAFNEGKQDEVHYRVKHDQKELNI